MYSELWRLPHLTQILFSILSLKKDLGIVKQIIHDSFPLQVIQNGNSHKRSFQSLHIFENQLNSSKYNLLCTPVSG